MADAERTAERDAPGVLRNLLERIADAAGAIRGRLFLLTLAVLAPAALAASLLIWDLYRNQRAQTQAQMVETTRALSLAMDRQVQQASATLTALSVSSSLQHNDLKAFDREAREVLAGKGAYIVVEDAAGFQRVNTLVAPGAPLPHGRAVSFQSRWNRLQSRGEIISDLFTGRVSRKLSVGVERLVIVNGQPTYDITLILTSDSVARVFAQHLPPSWLGGIMDRKYRLIARNRDNARYAGMQVGADVTRRFQHSSSGSFESVSLQGVETVAAFTRSDLTGWTMSVAMPRAEMDASINRSLALATVLGAALIVLGALLSLWFAGAVIRAVEALAAGAAALGRGERVALARTGVRETDAVAVAMQAAAEALHAREDELRGLNETLEIRVQDATERLVQAQKLESIGRLTGGVAHDFNNLLTAVIGNLDLLARRIQDEKLSRYVANARDAAGRGARLTAQLLAFARQQRLDPQAVDVNTVIEGMTTLLGSTLGGSVRVETALGRDLPAAHADRTQLELVILNLAINARDAMPRGGVLRIETDQIETKGPVRRPSDPPAGSHIRISVIDQGSGMPPEVLARVFEPFFTTKGPGAGSGLGLSQALGVLQQLGGGLVIDTDLGRGTAARIFLPLDASAVATSPSRAPSGAQAQLQGKRVLLVDDDPQVRGVTASLLRDAGVEVLEADGARAALDIVAKGEAADAVLLDYAMPEMNGAELAARLRELRPITPLVLMTGFADTAALAAAWTGPVLQKPFGADELTAAIAAVLGEG